MDTKRKLVIVGSGPAAWSAAIYAARAELKPLVLAGEQPGGQLMLTTKVENYPGFADGVMGQDLMAAMRQQAENLGVDIINQNAASINAENIHRPSFIIHHPSSMITASAVILATGASALTLKLPGEDRLMGRGVGTCAVCDAPFYRGKDTVFIVGGGDSAIEEATEISKFASNVIVLVRKDSMRGSPIMQKRIKSAQNIKVWYKSQAIELLGDKKLERVKVNKDGNIAEFPADGLFYAIGHKPATGWLAGSGVELDENGYIKTDFLKVDNLDVLDFDNLTTRKLDQDIKTSNIQDQKIQKLLSSKYPNFPTMTSVSGIFAAGDCVDFRYRQAIVAAGFGAMAALDCQRWLENK